LHLAYYLNLYAYSVFYLYISKELLGTVDRVFLKTALSSLSFCFQETRALKIYLDIYLGT
jgi:hypothetical protein